jgi:hypothetical protein
MRNADFVPSNFALARKPIRKVTEKKFEVHFCARPTATVRVIDLESESP